MANNRVRKFLNQNNKNLEKNRSTEVQPLKKLALQLLVRFVLELNGEPFTVDDNPYEQIPLETNHTLVVKDRKKKKLYVCFA